MTEVMKSKIYQMILIYTAVLTMPFVVVGRTIYVDNNADGANDGSSWADAYVCLQDALTEVQTGDEIQVAHGIYKPDQRSLRARWILEVRSSGDRTETFQLISGVTLKGGYAGVDESDPDARDIKIYETILSGDLNSDDGPNFTNHYENSYHVVTGSGTSETAVLDGFTITGGNANGPSHHDHGGGMYNSQSSPTVTNCTFTKNYSDSGSSMYNDNSTPTITSCTFSGNSAEDKGGGIYNDGGNMTLIDCVFIENTSVSNGAALKLASSDATITGCRFFGNMTLGGGSANAGAIDNDNSSPVIRDCTFVSNSSSGFSGGAIVNYGNSNPTVINCVFQGNSAGAGGGAIFNWMSSNPLVVNCIFTANFANRGGGMANNNNCHPKVINCTFVGNSAKDTGGGMWSRTESSPGLSNCIFWENTDNSGTNISESAQIDSDENSSITVNHCDIQGLTPGLGGTGNIGDRPFFVDADGVDNIIGTEDDNLRLLPDSPCIDAGDNSAISQSVATDLDGNPRIVNDTIDMGAYEAEAVLISSAYYVDAVNGDDNNNGLTFQTAFATIQKSIVVAADSDIVLVFPGLYQEEINFMGKKLTVQGVAISPVGVPVLYNTSDFAVSFYCGEGPDSVLKNFIIRDSFMGVFIVDSSPTISNLTIVGNKYGIEAYADSEPNISNSIFWDNTDGDLFGCQARYSCIERGSEGGGNITFDPLFVDPNIGDYHLRSERGRYWPEYDIWVLDKVTSPCVDGGDPKVDPSDERFPNGGRINIGAYGSTLEASLSPSQQLIPSAGKALNPYPANGAENVDINVTLSWISGFDGALHNVYLGTDFDQVKQSNLGDTLVGQQTSTNYDPGTLDYKQTYYWRIDEVSSEGIVTTGEVWSFTTASSPRPPKGRACFTAETGVWVNDSIVPISTVVLGQSACGLNSPYKIQEVQEHSGTFTCYDVLLGSGNFISVAENHYFLAEAGQWVSLKELKEGIKLQTQKGLAEIINITKRGKPYIGTVYNLKIDGTNQYLVGKDAVIVRDY